MSDRVKIKINRDQLDKYLNEVIPRALEAAGLAAEADAKLELDNAPRRIDTGLLRNSITHAISGQAPAISSYRGDKPSKYNFAGSHKGIPSGTYSGTAPSDPPMKQGVYIGTNVKYAAYVHEGFLLPSGKKVAPNRYMKNALEKNGAEYVKIIETYLKKG